MPDLLEQSVRLGDPIAMLDKIQIALTSLMNKEQELQREVDRLYRLGAVEAKPHYRDGKYLYLIYPMVNGERKREYIGADPDNIQEALDKIERKSQIEELENKLSSVKATISQTKYYLVQAISTAYSLG